MFIIVYKDNERSFTVEEVRKVNNSKVRFDGGRYMSSTPSGAAKKAFSQIQRVQSAAPKSLKITIRETTQNSKHKMYKYKVTKENNETEISLGNTDITFGYTVKTKAI